MQNQYLILTYFISLVFLMGYGIYLYKTDWSYGDSDLLFMAVLAVCPFINVFGAVVFIVFLLAKTIIRFEGLK